MKPFKQNSESLANSSSRHASLALTFSHRSTNIMVTYGIETDKEVRYMKRFYRETYPSIDPGLSQRECLKANT